MKNKKILVIVIVVLFVMITIIVLFIKRSNGFKTVNSLLTNLENTINNEDSDKIIDFYPDFIKSSLPNFSENKIKEFHNLVGDISFEITHQNKCNTEEILSQQDEINSEYNCNIKLEGYQILICKYHEDLGESIYELIKIDGRWYLYYLGYLPEPLNYFE